MDRDACADSTRPYLLSTLLQGAALGRSLIQGGLGQWISTLVRTLRDLFCFDFVVRSRDGTALDSRGAGAVDLDACADPARPFLLLTLLHVAALGRRLI